MPVGIPQMHGFGQTRYTLWMTWALILAAGCTDRLSKPTPPDGQVLRLAYQLPTEALTPINAASIARAVQARLGAFSVLCGSELQTPNCNGTSLSLCASLKDLADLLATLHPQNEVQTQTEQQTGFELGDVRVQGAGYAELKRVCAGTDPVPSPHASNGNITLRMGFSNAGVDATVWGKFNQCLNQHEQTPQRTDGNVQLYYNAVTPLNDLAVASPITAFDGEVTEQNDVTPTEVDFRFVPEHCEAQLRVPVSDTTHVLYTTSSDNTGLIASNGPWRCDFVQGLCLNADNQTITWPVELP